MILIHSRTFLTILLLNFAAPIPPQLTIPHKGETLPTFEVATVKPSSNDLGRSFHVSIWANDNMYRTQNTTLRDLIRTAFDAHGAAQITGGSDTMLTARWDINAKIGDDDYAHLKTLPPEERARAVNLMLQGLLTDRFGLKVHIETRELAVFNLVLDKGGSKLQTSVPQTSASSTEVPDSNGLRASAPAKARKRNVSTHVSNDEGKMTATDATVADLATMLGRQPELDGRTVIDDTGLTRKYDWTLEWHPLSMNPADTDATAPSLFSALKEQLGLTLKPSTGPVQIVVIDAVSTPAPN